MLGKEVQKQTIGYIIAAMGFVAGLAWNETIKAFVEYLFPLNKNDLLVKFLYAILVTLLVVIISINLTRLLEKKEENEA